MHHHRWGRFCGVFYNLKLPLKANLQDMEQQNEVPFLEVIRNDSSGSFALLAYSNGFFISWI
jgi:hypothetical protein